MTCYRCIAFADRRDIRSPDDLNLAIRHARKGLAKGVLDIVPVDGGLPFEQAGDGAWDDIVHYRFRCRGCGQAFLLGAETYHGGGGAWERVGADGEPDEAPVETSPGTWRFNWPTFLVAAGIALAAFVATLNGRG
ncbi:MAG TPA: hypothetical protein VEA15_03995 [Caulobacteraceae bacterium]|nr:hypothetical protein [Caulobacteraceae bacterium]